MPSPNISTLPGRTLDAGGGVIRIRRGVVRVSGGRKVKWPKSEAGKRDVAIPRHLIPSGEGSPS